MARTGVRAVAIIIRDDKVALIHRKKEGRDYWVFPGGGVEDGETSQESVIREIQEELSLKGKVIKLLFSVESYPGGNKDPYFLCSVDSDEIKLGGPERERQSEENWYGPQWVEFEKVRNFNLLPETAKNEFLSFIKKQI